MKLKLISHHTKKERKIIRRKQTKIQLHFAFLASLHYSRQTLAMRLMNESCDRCQVIILRLSLFPHSFACTCLSACLLPSLVLLDRPASRLSCLPACLPASLSLLLHRPAFCLPCLLACFPSLSVSTVCLLCLPTCGFVTPGCLLSFCLPFVSLLVCLSFVVSVSLLFACYLSTSPSYFPIRLLAHISF